MSALLLAKSLVLMALFLDITEFDTERLPTASLFCINNTL